ncbi:MAG: TadE/TadG family type IV pilus assembly protein [Rickettsiales bacterium]
MKLLKIFLKENTGTALPIVGLIFLAMVAAAGSAIDYGRAQMSQTKLQSALDSATLAAGTRVRTLMEQNGRQAVHSEVQRYLRGNFQQNYMKTNHNVQLGDIQVINLDTNRGREIRVTARATGQVQTLMMRIFNFPSIEISAYSEVTQARTVGLEMVMALDNSNSMNSPARIGALTGCAQYVGYFIWE